MGDHDFILLVYFLVVLLLLVVVVVTVACACWRACVRALACVCVSIIQIHILKLWKFKSACTVGYVLSYAGHQKRLNPQARPSTKEKKTRISLLPTGNCTLLQDSPTCRTVNAILDHTVPRAHSVIPSPVQRDSDHQ